MSRFRPVLLGRRSGVALAALMVLGAATAGAQNVVSAPTPGRIDFNNAGLPPATVEVDLSQGMFGDLFGIGDAAIAGVAEAFSQSADANEGAEGTKQAAEQLAAAREVIQLARQVVQEVRVRIYEDSGGDSLKADGLTSQFDGQLQANGWEKMVQINDGDDNVRVSMLRAAGAIRGVFVIVADGNDLVLVNVVCDVSPERVKELTATAAKIGLENGLQPMIEEKMKHIRHKWPQGPRGPEHGRSNGRAQ
jgi:hypothetical protein